MVSGWADTSVMPKDGASKFPSTKQHETVDVELLKDSFNQGSNTNLWGYFGKVFLFLTVMVGAVYGFSKFPFKKFNRNVFAKNDQDFKIIFQKYLGSKHRIMLVNVFEKYLLLGMTDQSINLLKEYHSNELDEINFEESVSSNNSFVGFLKRSISNEA